MRQTPLGDCVNPIHVCDRLSLEKTSSFGLLHAGTGSITLSTFAEGRTGCSPSEGSGQFQVYL